MADGEDVKLGGAYVEVHLRDKTQQDEAAIRRKLEQGKPVDFDTALKNPKNAAAIRKAVESGPAAKIATEIDVQQAIRLAQAKLNELSAKKNAITLAYDADVRKAEAAIEALRKKAADKKVDVDADVAKYQAKIEQIKATKVRTVAEIEVNENKIRAQMRALGEQAGKALGDGLAQGVKSKAKDTDDALSSVAKRANAQFKALEFGAYFAGLPIAAAAAGASTAAALSGVPLLFAAIAVAASQSNPKVAKSFDDLASHVVSSTEAMAKPLEDDLVDIADKVGASFDRMAPQIAYAMEAGVDAIDPLIDGVTGFAERAMPGFVRAIQNSDAPMRGWEALLKSAGSGLTDFLDNLSEGAEGSEEILKTLGHMIQDFLGGTGEIFGNLSANGGPALEDFRAALQSVYSLLESVTDEGSALYSFFSGFSGAVTTVAGAFKGLNEVLGGSLGPLASMLGAYKALNMLSFGKLGDAIGGIGKNAKSAKGDVEGLGGGFASTAKGAGAMVAFAAILEGAMFSVQRRAKEGTAQLDEHRDAIDTLTAALQASGGVFDDYAASQLQATDLWKLAAGNARAVGLDVNAMTDAVGRGGPAYDSFRDSAVGAFKSLVTESGRADETTESVFRKIEEFAQQGGSASQMVAQIDDIARSWQKSTGASDAETESYKNKLIAAANLVGQLNSMKGAVEEAAAAFKKDEEARRNVDTASQNAAQATKELGAAYEVIADRAASAEDKTAAFLDVLEKIQDADFSQEASIKGMNDTLREFEKGVGGLSDKLLDANGKINTTSEVGSKLFDVVTQLGGGFANAGMSIDDLVQAGVPLGEALTTTNNELLTARERFIQMADAQGLSREAAEKLADRYGLSTEALGQYLHSVGEGTLATEGITKRVDELGNEIYTLPDGKEITFTADTGQAKEALYGFKNDLEHLEFITQITANTHQASQKFQEWGWGVENSTSTADLDADPGGAFGALKGWLGAGNSAVAIGRQDANNDAALKSLAYWSAAVRATTATGKVNADISSAMKTWAWWQPASKVANIFTKIWGGAATGGEVRGYADGGQVQNFDDGGPVVGPGTGTSDSIPAMLSNGEIVIKEKESQEHREGLLAVNAGVPPEQAFGLNLGDGKGGSAAGGTVVHWTGDVVIDAKSIQDISDIAEFFDKVIPAARQGSGSLAGVK
ncbi:hypothetical protein [Amycolatopsis albispora]|uniref:Tape measure protein n=1 Tax=Amycolatopsis albispora TaxID=1804986 RepID=A0A344LGZ0_9PSEU|nr:hypothetical protein [Amycolatopsis albispora]AXB47314.1 hypothetical protein A4R43_36715 [Amycolatopsis albispora]